MIFNSVMGEGMGSLPRFAYTGQYQLIDDGRAGSRRNWRIRFLTSGVLTFDRLSTPIDVFLVGGGGGNGNTKSVTTKSGSGGGGYTLTKRNQRLEEDAPYEIQIGAGSEMPEKESEISFIFHNETPKLGRNDPCPCGSGKKYKKCCGR